MDYRTISWDHTILGLWKGEQEEKQEEAESEQRYGHHQRYSCVS